MNVGPRAGALVYLIVMKEVGGVRFQGLDLKLEDVVTRDSGRLGMLSIVIMSMT